MKKYDIAELSNYPYPHRHLWQEYIDKDKKTNKTVTILKCKFCHIIKNNFQN